MPTPLESYSNALRKIPTYLRHDFERYFIGAISTEVDIESMERAISSAEACITEYHLPKREEVIQDDSD